MTAASTCPLCDRPVDPAHRPFCSRGCRDRDLLQWLGEGYRLPGSVGDVNEDAGLDTPGERG